MANYRVNYQLSSGLFSRQFSQVRLVLNHLQALDDKKEKSTFRTAQKWGTADLLRHNSNVVLNLFYRSNYNKRLEILKTKSVKPIIRLFLCGHFLKVLENTIGWVVGSSEKVRKVGMIAWPYFNSLTISETTQKWQKVDFQNWLKKVF